MTVSTIARLRPGLGLFAKPLRVAMLLVFPVPIVAWAEGQLQDWIPGVLTMPDDVEVIADRSVGSTVRMLSISTAADVVVLFADWEESLESNGYSIVRVEGDALENAIQFSGPGISNAKIILSPTPEDGRHHIEFDATLE